MADADDLEPYVASSVRMPELSLRAVVLGAALSLTFGMVNAYRAVWLL